MCKEEMGKGVPAPATMTEQTHTIRTSSWGYTGLLNSSDKIYK